MIDKATDVAVHASDLRGIDFHAAFLPGLVSLVPWQKHAIEVIADVGAVGEGSIPSEMPLPHAGCGVALLLKHLAHRQALFIEQGRIPIPCDATGQFAAPAIAAGQEAIPGRGADRGSAVRVGEGHSLSGKAIDVRGRNL